jgi:hypothetical protein
MASRNEGDLAPSGWSEPVWFEITEWPLLPRLPGLPGGSFNTNDEREVYVSDLVWRVSCGMAPRLECLPRCGWVDSPSAGGRGHFFNPPLRARPNSVGGQFGLMC